MAIRNIVQDGDPILKKVCRPVTSFDEKLGVLLDDMKDTLIKAQGLGLAGPQVGMLRRLFIILEVNEDEDGEENLGEERFIEFVNPEIIYTDGEEMGYEGCLSFPNKNGAIKRPTTVTVRAQDRNGEFFEYTGKGINARCLCHESNHLDGVTIMDLAEYFYEDTDDEENDGENEE